MKRQKVLTLLLASAVLAPIAPVSAGDGHWRERHQHSSRHHRQETHVTHHHHAPSRVRGEYLVGGVILGAVISEALRPTRSVVRETVVIDRGGRAQEYLRDSDGRCYYIERLGDRKVLTEVDPFSCSR